MSATGAVALKTGEIEASNRAGARKTPLEQQISTSFRNGWFS